MEYKFNDHPGLARTTILPFEVKSWDEEGYFNGYASVFDIVDHHHDVMVPGAFRSYLEAQMAKEIPVLLEHQTDQLIGFTRVLHEDATGLFFKAQLLLNRPQAQEAYEHIKAGTLQGISIGYRPLLCRTDAHTQIRYIESVELKEISLVSLPANPFAKVLEVKTGPTEDALVLQEYSNCLQLCDRAIAVLQSEI